MKPTTLVFTLLASVVAAHASADSDAPSQTKLNKLLKGRYAIVETYTCVSSPQGFGPAPQYAALGPTATTSGNGLLIGTYNGDGTLTFDGQSRAVEASTASSSYPVTTSNFSCPGSYRVNPDNSFEATSTCAGNVVNGVVPGLAFTLSPIQTAGYIGKNELVFTTPVESIIESVTTVYGTVPRICTRSDKAIKLPNPDKNDD